MANLIKRNPKKHLDQVGGGTVYRIFRANFPESRGCLKYPCP